MTDAEFLAALEAATLPESAFTHREHVRAAYLYLRRGSFGAALDAMAAALRRYAAAQGRPDRYHETMTVAFMALINERLAGDGDPGSWPAFAACHPDLLGRGLLAAYYPAAFLADERARRVFRLRPLTDG